MTQQAHKTPQEKANIIQLASLMNKSSQRTESDINGLYELIGAKPLNSTPELPTIEKHPLTEEFLIGFLEGDGSFYVSFKAKKRIEFGFNIVGSIEYLDLFHEIQKFFGCGTVTIKSSTIIRYNLESKKAIRDILIPFIDKHTLHTDKKKSL
jgi:hypothetical protein